MAKKGKGKKKPVTAQTVAVQRKKSSTRCKKGQVATYKCKKTGCRQRLKPAKRASKLPRRTVMSGPTGVAYRVATKKKKMWVPV